MSLYVIIPDVVPLECLWQVLLPVITVAILVRVVAIVVSAHGLATLRAGLGVALLLEQLLEILLLRGGAEPDLLVVAAAAISANGNVQVVIIQPCDDLQHGLRDSAQVSHDLGSDAVWPAPLIPRRRLVHMQ